VQLGQGARAGASGHGSGLLGILDGTARVLEGRFRIALLQTAQGAQAARESVVGIVFQELVETAHGRAQLPVAAHPIRFEALGFDQLGQLGLGRILDRRGRGEVGAGKPGQAGRCPEPSHSRASCAPCAVWSRAIRKRPSRTRAVPSRMPSRPLP